MDVQLRANFSGHVQGVGFRYQTVTISRNFDVQGYVQNMADGTVDLVAEGEKSVLKEFLSSIESHLSQNIRETKVNWCDPSGNYTGFDIRR